MNGLPPVTATVVPDVKLDSERLYTARTTRRSDRLSA